MTSAQESELGRALPRQWSDETEGGKFAHDKEYLLVGHVQPILCNSEYTFLLETARDGEGHEVSTPLDGLCAQQCGRHAHLA